MGMTAETNLVFEYTYTMTNELQIVIEEGVVNGSHTNGNLGERRMKLGDKKVPVFPDGRGIGKRHPWRKRLRSSKTKNE